MTTGFQIVTGDAGSDARTGRLHTPHGAVRTPAFMPVGTRGAVKGLTPQQVRDTGAEIVLANTYHLLLRPGVEAVERLGGLHRLMAWDGPILTDSGGFQVFSLQSLRRIDDDGVRFASHIDGAPLELTPAGVIDAQNRLGADVIMCFDECPALPCPPQALRAAVDRTIRWAEQCKRAHRRTDQMLFGIVQGGLDANLRADCARALAAMDFDGYAIGGLSVGEGPTERETAVRATTPHLPADKPRYLMGVGTPMDILAAVAAGVDMFDCVLPTRNGRNAYAFTLDGPVRLRNAVHADDDGPIEPGCDCYACRHFTRAALRHFFNVGEMLGPILVSWHNLRFYQRWMAAIRDHIDRGDFTAWATREKQRYEHRTQTAVDPTTDAAETDTNADSGTRAIPDAEPKDIERKENNP